jgi:hypothetical protein
MLAIAISCHFIVRTAISPALWRATGPSYGTKACFSKNDLQASRDSLPSIHAMDLRIRNLEALDAQAVPLPHGTEVVTRTVRTLDGRRVPQGSVGRVVANEAKGVKVALVGIGEVLYQRNELSARRVGQALYAQRRANAWDSLQSCIVLDTVVGSKAWGLADENSDEDHRGVFALPHAWLGGLSAPPEDLVSADGSACYWSFQKTVAQALRADPNTLEMLFVPGAEARDLIGEWLLAERDAFVSSEIFGTFGRYAIGQLRRLAQGLRLAQHRGMVLDWLRADPSLTLDALAVKVAASLHDTGALESDTVAQAKQHIKQLYRSMHDQGLLNANEFSALVHFARDRSHEFELARTLRPKNAYNLLRLLGTARGWLVEGVPSFEVTGEFRQRLLAIKRGEVPLEDVLAEAEALAVPLEEAYRTTRLPKRPNVARADALLKRVHHELARRAVLREPGPFGSDAPEVPGVEWDE